MGKLHKTAKILLIIILNGAALAVPELWARFFMPEWKPIISDAPSLFVPNPYTGWLHPPRTLVDNRGEKVFSNSLGLRDKELNKKVQPRILFLGDSFTWGWGIHDEERYTNRLQLKLPGYQVVNAGISGFGTLQEYFLLKHFVDEIQPDYVVLQIYENDFADNLVFDGLYPHPYVDYLNNFQISHNRSSAQPPGLIKRSLFYVGEHTYFYRQVLIRLFQLWVALDEKMFTAVDPPPATQQDLIRGMEISLGMLYQFCADNKIPIIAFASALEPVQKDTIVAISKKYSVNFYDLEDMFSKTTTEYHLGDKSGHWSDYGNQLVADYMYPHIVSMISASEKK